MSALVSLARRPASMFARSPRVLVLTADYAPGNWSGIGVAVASQARALAARGAHVEVLWASPDQPAGSPSANRSGPWRRDGVVVHPQGPGVCAVDPAAFDLVHVHSLALSELALEIRRRFHLPLVYTSHAAVAHELEPGPRRAFWSDVQRTLIDAAERIVVLSHSQMTELCAIAPHARSRVVVVPNGIEPAGAASSPLPRRGPILFAGRWARSKGTALLEPLMDRLIAQRDLRFVIAGGHGDTEGSAVVERLRNRHRGRLDVRAWCDADEMDALYRAACLTLVPSEYEPFGLVALEAMRAGCPVVARATGGLVEVVGSDSGGILVDNDDAGTWARVVCELLDDGDRRAALQLAGPRFVADRFSAGATAERLLSVVYPGLST